MAQGLVTSLSEITTASRGQYGRFFSARINGFTVSRIVASLGLQPAEQRRKLLREGFHALHLFLGICDEFYSLLDCASKSIRTISKLQTSLRDILELNTPVNG